MFVSLMPGACGLGRDLNVLRSGLSRVGVQAHVDTFSV